MPSASLTESMRDRLLEIAKGRQGLIEGFTGIDDPYEPPVDADLRIDTSQMSPEEAAEMVMGRLVQDGYVVAAHP